MKDGEDCYQHARRCLQNRYWRGTVQNAQLAIELCTKAIISLFEEPDWTHSPKQQLLRIIEERKGEMGDER
jgi:HEPN domain-containing protein